MTLAEHLAKGYDAYVHGIRGPGKWSKQTLVDDLNNDPAFKAEATAKLAELRGVIAARGERACSVSTMQARILSDGFKSLGS